MSGETADADGLLDLLGRRPDVGQEDRLAIATVADRLGQKVDLHGPGKRERHHERRRSEVAGARQRMDAALEVAVAGENRRDHESLLSIALATSASSGPLLPMQVVQP